MKNSIEEKVKYHFFKDGKLVKLPVKLSKKRVVIEEFAKLFSPYCFYSEKEVNEIIKLKFADYCTVRRLLIEFGLMVRERGIYRLRVLTSEHPNY